MPSDASVAMPGAGAWTPDGHYFIASNNPSSHGVVLPCGWSMVGHLCPMRWRKLVPARVPLWALSQPCTSRGDLPLPVRHHRRPLGCESWRRAPWPVIAIVALDHRHIIVIPTRRRQLRTIDLLGDNMFLSCCSTSPVSWLTVGAGRTDFDGLSHRWLLIAGAVFTLMAAS